MLGYHALGTARGSCAACRRAQRAAHTGHRRADAGGHAEDDLAGGLQHVRPRAHDACARA